MYYVYIGCDVCMCSCKCYVHWLHAVGFCYFDIAPNGAISGCLRNAHRCILKRLNKIRATLCEWWSWRLLMFVCESIETLYLTGLNFFYITEWKKMCRERKTAVFCLLFYRWKWFFIGKRVYIKTTHISSIFSSSKRRFNLLYCNRLIGYWSIHKLALWYEIFFLVLKIC